MTGRELKIHEIKEERQHIDALLDGTRTTEVRDSDRNYRVGDVLVIREIYDDGQTGGRGAVCLVRSILYPHQVKGLKKDFVALSVELLHAKKS